MRRSVTRLPGFSLLRRLKHRFSGAPASQAYQLLPVSEISSELIAGWKSDSIPQRQRRIVNAELAQMRRGHVPRQFAVAAEAVRQTGGLNPRLLEIGCASGFYSEVLDYLLNLRLSYTGLDYSPALLDLARATYPAIPFLNGDAARLPFADSTWDLVISGCVILHLRDWQTAIAETARIAKDWCIFHRTPVWAGATTLMTKRAYGVEVLEWRFGETELLDLIRTHGLELVSTWPIAVETTVEAVAGPLSSMTYLFHKVA